MLNFLDSTAAAPAPDGSSVPKYSEQPLDRYLLNIDKLIQDDTESNESKIRAQTIIQMCRRYRGATPSDLFGFWKSGTWAESPKFSSLHGTNVFQALIHGAEAGYMQADILLDIAAKANNFQNRSVEKIARSIYEVLVKTQWNEITKQAIFFSSILKLNAYCISVFDKAGGDKLPVPEYASMQYQQGGMFVCPSCYTTGEYMPGEETCPNCGSPVSVIDDPQAVADYVVPGFSDVKTGETRMIIADGLDVSVDDRQGKAADVEACNWVQWRYMAQKGELKKLYPHLELKEKPVWSYPTRLKIALRKYESGEAMPRTKFEKNNYEVKQTWLGCGEYEDYVAPADIQIGKFVLKAGQRLYDVAPDGLVFGVVNNEIAFVDPEDKNRRVKACLWLADPTSFYGMGARAGLPIQKKINQLDNMAMEGEARSLKGSVVYVPEAVDGAHLEGANTNIPLRPDFATGGQPMKNFIMPLNVSGLSQSSLMFLSSQVETMQRVMGVPDVALGEGDPYAKTATGQSLVAQRAAGLLVPAKRSEAQMKVGWLQDQLDIIQKFYSVEALKMFGSKYGEEWLDDEIQAFFDSDIKKAVSISIVAGSEIPESRLEKQMKLRQDILAGFVPMTPELQCKLAQQSGYDGIDVNDYESNNKLAQKRLNTLLEITADPAVEQQFQALEFQLTDPKTGMRATDEMGNEIPNPVLLQILQAPVFKIHQFAENQDQQFQYWSDKYRQFMSSGGPQPAVVMAVCDAMIRRHQQASFEAAARAQALAALTMMPGQAGQMAMANQFTPQEKESKSDKKT